VESLEPGTPLRTVLQRTSISKRRSISWAAQSTIYHISTGHAPYENFDSDQVRALYSQGDYPDTSSLLLDKNIRQCWSGHVKTTEEVAIAIAALLGTSLSIPRDSPGPNAE
jgi:hypothetical protein